MDPTPRNSDSMASVDPLLTHDGGIPTQTTSEDVLDRKVFIGGLSWQTTAENLRNYFQNFGDIAEAVLMIDKRTGQPRGFGFVTFLNTAAVDRVMAQGIHTIDSRNVDVKRAVPKDKMAPSGGGVGHPNVPESKKIFVGGLAPEVTEKEFKEYFEQFGPIQDSIVMYDKKTNRSRGFGFVTFEAEDGVKAVLARQHEIMGKWVEIKRAEPRDNRMDGMMDPYGYGRGGMRYAPGYGEPIGYGAAAPPRGGAAYAYAAPYPAPSAVVAYGGPRGAVPYAGYGYAGAHQPAPAAFYPPGGFAGYGAASGVPPQGGGYRGGGAGGSYSSHQRSVDARSGGPAGGGGYGNRMGGQGRSDRGYRPY